MYTEYFHLNSRPFSISPDPTCLYNSAIHQEGLAHLRYGIEHGGGFVVLTGEVGTGKTLLCYCLLRHLPADVDIALILNPKLSASDLLAAICDELRISYSPRQRSLKDLIDLLNRHLLEAHASGRQTVVIIDEAQLLGLDVLEQIRLLTNLETSSAKLLQIILIGQPELQDLLSRRELRQLSQRISARYHLEALSQTETSNYIRHRLALCHGSSDLFTSAAIKKIYHYSGGIPRLINKICDRALLAAYTQGRSQVKTNLIEQSAKELHLLLPQAGRGSGSAWILSSALLLISVALVWLSFNPGLQQQLFKQGAIAEMPAEHQDIVSILQRQHQDLSYLINLAASLNGKQLPEGNKVNCEQLAKVNLYCLIDKAQFKEILDLKRPAILELEVGTDNKIPVLLEKVMGKEVQINVGTPLRFPLIELLKYWNGFYLVLWEAPMANAMNILPYQVSPAVLWLRQQLGGVALAGGGNAELFDRDLVQKVRQFQKNHGLVEDGIVGGRTLIYLQNTNLPPQVKPLIIED